MAYKEFFSAQFSRRTWIGGLCRCFAAVFFAGTTGTLVSACGKESAEETGPLPPLSLGPVEEIPEGRSFNKLFRLMLYRESQADSPEFKLSALSMVCTHMTCLLREANSGLGFACPCHGSRFAADGKLEQGPAKKDLPWFELSLDANRNVLVHRDKPVESSWRLLVSSPYSVSSESKA